MMFLFLIYNKYDIIITMKCLLLINASSGNSDWIAEDKELLTALRKTYDTVDKKIFTAEDGFNIASESKGYDTLILCGGDGTFNYAINALRDSNIELIYLPCGTFNDCAHTLKKLDGNNPKKGQFRLDLGEINGRLFSYVAAAGSFTPIGYLPKNKYKKAFKRLVYYFYAFKEYKVHKINAKMKVDGRLFEDCYTLIMAVNSRYVFGFSFNRIFHLNDGKGQLLLIKAPKGPFGFIKLFFLFFRAFFVGFDSEYDGKNIKFLSFKRCMLQLEKPVEFCVDGERLLSGRANEIWMHKERGSVILTGAKDFLSE